MAVKRNDWLLDHRKNVTSQHGEDGILQKIFELIPSTGDRWCVEFGAWDGKLLSNTWNLIENKKWHGVLIEGDQERHKDLMRTYTGNDRAVCLCAFVTFSGPSSLENVLRKTKIPKNFDLISIDIYGCDYHIWDSMKKYSPKVVCIEFNPTIPNNIDFVQVKDFSVVHGSSLRGMIALSKRKGYELVCVTGVNAIFVKKQYYSLFGIADNSIDEMYKDRQHQTQMYQLYDGTLVYVGKKQLVWHNVEFNERKMQVLPKFLRGGYGNTKTVTILILRALGILKPRIPLDGKALKKLNRFLNFYKLNTKVK